MSLKNSELNYGIVSRANHWLSAFIFIALLAVGLYMTGLEKGEDRQALYALHKSMGIAIFGLMVLRLIWLKFSPNPVQLSKSKFEHILAHSVKGLLYLAMLGMPISGWIMSNSGGHEVAFFDMFVLPTIIGEHETTHEISEFIHSTFGFLLIAIVLLHIVGALKHHFIYKDVALLRMVGKNKATAMTKNDIEEN
ncbi:cytochrome b [Thiomicrorhabdus arctica]|jgi:cytochrome b561|uniref:cytochrome b n=1 Tax=Thiomicrorhabdus arctica TaxID=131540 RepID=UPI00035E32E0|nr:cytochrome b [Thiomicrorhabdus arctica]